MNTKTNLLLSALCVLLFTACEKNIPEPEDLLTPTEQILTGSTWKYNEYFANYSLKSAAVTYKIGKPNNLSDYSQNRVRFKEDHTYFEVTQTGDTLKGTWQLVQNNTKLEVKNSVGIFLSTLLTLNNTSLEWHDEQRNVLARMIPADFNQQPSVTTSKLTGKKWMYQEYFIDFSRRETGLVYKRDKPNNLLDLNKNRVQFNADGSVTEINEEGNSVPGTWKFITVGPVTGTEVSNYIGRFQSALIHLDDSALVWFDPLTDRYAKMVLAPNDATTAVSARAKMLTSKAWIYTEYFSNYTAPTAQLSYKRDKSTANAMNLTPSRVTFNLNGTFTEITPNNTTLLGTWQLLENETKLKTVSAAGTLNAEIVHLDTTGFLWHDAVNNRYAKMSTSPYTPGYAVAAAQLTGKTWIYYEYFSQYSTMQSVLVYKRERSANALNLAGSTTVFNANGTFSEINENGQSISGNWQILNGNQLWTSNSLGGTHLANLIMLNDRSFIWHNIAEDTYAKMVVKL